MSETKNLKLFKHDEPLETNENKFDIDLALNQNWDKIDKFADTVDNKVTNLQEQNTKLQAQIKKDRENMINLEVEGQSIHIEDSSDLEGQLEVLGNVEQDTREGYNLCPDDINNWESGQYGGDGNKAPDNNAIRLKELLKIDSNSSYFLRTFSTDYNFIIRVYNANKVFTRSLGSQADSSIIKINDNEEYLGISLWSPKGKPIAFDDYVELFKNNIVKPFITTESNKEKPYEQYGASPSPEFPSVIRAVGDNINLLENTAKTLTTNGITFTVNTDGTVTANGTATSLAQISLVANVKLPAGTYTIKDGKAYVESTEFNDWFDGLNNPSTLTFNTEVLLKNVYIQVKQGETVNNKIFSPKLEKGTVATSYSKFGQGSVEIKKTAANYYNVKSYAGSNPPLVDKDDWITLTGNNTGNSTTYLNYFNKNLDLVIGDKYWIVAEIKESSGEGNFSITSRMNNQGQFDTHTVSVANLKAGDKVIYKATALKTEGAEHGLRTFISLSQGESCNITFRISVLETEPNKSNWKYVPYKKETKILPIQKPMLIRDYFDKLNNKEVHTWKKIVLDGVNNKVTQTTTNQSGKYRYQYIDKDLKDCSLSEEKAYCTHLPLIGKSKTYDKILGFTVANNSIYIYTDGDTAVNFNAKLQNENYIFYIPVIESAYQKIDLTPKQIEVLDQLDNLETYKPVTNITTDSIAKIKLKYIADTKTYVDNKTSNLEQQVSVINQLLSTTKTSSVLLDNLQKDIESEVL